MGLFSKIAGSFVNERVTNTKTAFQLIVDDFKRYIVILKYIFLAFSVATIVYGIIVHVGTRIINYCLLGLLVIYTIIDAILKKKENPDPSKKVRLIYAWSKIVLNGAALASSLYALYASAGAEQVNPISIVLSTLSIIMFVLKILVEICLDIFSSKWRLLKTGMILDATDHPSTAGKIFSPLIGDIVEEQNLKEVDIKRIQDKQNNQ